MRRFWLPKVLAVVAATAALVGLAGLLVMSLWNWLVPGISGWHALSFPQAIALLLLCRLLFGGRRGHLRGAWRERLRERFRTMTPAEQASLRARFRGCGRTVDAHDSPTP